jgi:hypothetical protein
MDPNTEPASLPESKAAELLTVLLPAHFFRWTDTTKERFELAHGISSHTPIKAPIQNRMV